MNLSANYNRHWVFETDLVEGSGQTASATIISSPIGAIHFAGSVHFREPSKFIRALGLPPQATEIDALFHAYRLGVDFASELYGEFSFALFDPINGRCLMARGALGTTPLYYHHNGTRLVASNSLDLIYQRVGCDSVLNDRVVAEWCLNSSVVNLRRTFFEGLDKCPPGCLLTISAQGKHERRFWDPKDVPSVHFTNTHDYSARLNDLLRQAITQRTSQSACVGVHLSGGLDSTPIAIVAGRALPAERRPLYTFNWCLPAVDGSDNRHEWEDARRIANLEGFIHSESGITSDSLRHILLNHNVARDGTTMFEYESQVLFLAQKLGVQSILSGFGGDEILTTRSRDRHHHAIRSGRLIYGLRRLAMESDLSTVRGSARFIKQYTSLLFRSAFPNDLNNQSSNPANQQHLDRIMELLRPDFAAYAKDFQHDHVERYAISPSIRDRQHIMIQSGYHQERIESWAILGSRAGIDYRYPLLDQGLVEFALGIPTDLYYRAGRPRDLYLNALGDILPPFLRDKGKPKESARVNHLIQAYVAALMDPSVVEMVASSRSPYINTQALLKRITSLEQHAATGSEDAALTVLSTASAVLSLNLTPR